MTSTNNKASNNMQNLLEKTKNRNATIGVIGQGYVGLPLALVFAEAGFSAIGFDVDPKKISSLQRGESYIKHIGPERVANSVRAGKFSATTNFDKLAECDAIFICVPTPLGKHREPDNSFIHATSEEIARRLRPGQLVVLESTTYPGTTDYEVLPILTKNGLRCPEDFLLAFSPEREDPGNSTFSTRNTPKLVGGVNPESTEVAAAFYSMALEKVVKLSSAKVAESGKLLENIFRSVNIALVNELKMVFDRMGIDVWEVIEAAKTKPFGFMPFYPGPGLGGHCIPLDPFYLSWKAAEHGTWARFIELAGEINTSMPHYVIRKTSEALNEDGKCLKGSRILVLGLAYKANIDDDRESPSYEIIDLLQEAGAQVEYCDPFLPVAKHTRKYQLDLSSVPCDPKTFSQFDALIVSTAHQIFKKPDLFKEVKIVIDCRNLLKEMSIQGERPRIVKA
jgi:UDP-N-acetyl-D-glucosamine dehydrogenase